MSRAATRGPQRDGNLAGAAIWIKASSGPN